MRSTQVMKLAVIATMAAAGVLAPAGLCPAETFSGTTKPSEDVVVAFVRPGEIAVVAVKEGQSAKAGQVLVALDDRAERARLEQLDAQYKDTTARDAAKLQLDQADVDLKMSQEAFKKGALTDLEIRHTQLERDIAEFRHKLRIFEKTQEKRQYEAEKILVERMTKLSPIDGRVERVLVEVGESVDALTPVVQVVQTDPLWIEVGVPIPVATRLKIGQPATVRVDSARYGGELAISLGTGKVSYIASVATGGATKLRVRVVLPNPKRHPAGMHVLVEFPPQEQANKPKASPTLAGKTQPKGELNVSKGKHTPGR